MSAEPRKEIRFPVRDGRDPRPASLRAAVTVGAILVAALGAMILFQRAGGAEAGSRGASLYNSGSPGLAYPHLLAAARASSLQAKPCLELGDLAVWTIDDGVFQHFYKFDDARTLVHLAFVSYVEAILRQPGSSKAWAGLAELFKKERILHMKEGALNLDTLDSEHPTSYEEEDRLVIEAYRRASRLEPNNYFYQAYLGDFFDERGFRSEALASYGKAVEIMPDLSWHYYLPRTDVPEDLYASTRESLETALRTNPLYPKDRIWQNLADLAERGKDPETAIRAYRQAIDASADPSPYLQMLGALYFDMKRYDEAEQTLKESLQRDTLQPRTKGLAYALLGRCAMVRNDYQAAIQFLKQARWLSPAASYVSVELGRAYEALGMLDKAESEYQAAIRTEPGRVSVYTSLIDMYRRTHQINKAITLATKLVQMYPDNEIFKEQLRSLNREMGRPDAG